MNLVVHVRYCGGAYVARCNGKSASCTAGPERAARSAAEKAGAGKHARLVGSISQAPDRWIQEPARYIYEVNRDLKPAEVPAP